jgi:hypothetical protein
MKKNKRAKDVYSSAWQNKPPQNHPSRIESLAATPWIETFFAVIVGLIFLAVGKRELAELTWVIGVALSFTRYAFSKKLEEEMLPLHKLTSVMDLQRQMSVSQFQEMIRIYLEITEPEFRRVKDTIITEAIERLSELAQQKTSDQLATGDYYNWLLPIIQSTLHGSSMWAVSMMLSIEWDDSPAEQSFLRLNLDAAQRGVFVERIFVVPQSVIPNLYSIKAIREQLDNAGDYLKPLVVEREFLEAHDPQLLKQLGDGLIAFDSRVALIDTLTPEGIRGYVTMNPGRITRLRRMFENLRVHARPLSEVVKAPQSEHPNSAEMSR